MERVERIVDRHRGRHGIQCGCRPTSTCTCSPSTASTRLRPPSPCPAAERALSRTLGLAIAHHLLTPPTGAEQQHCASPLTPTRSSLPRHRSCTGPTLAGSKLHHDDRDISALGPPVTDRPASMPILLRQRRSVGCFTFPPAKSDDPELPLWIMRCHDSVLLGDGVRENTLFGEYLWGSNPHRQSAYINSAFWR